ncbi:MAG: arginine--tRNA ligase [Bacilli bacterium]|nr:arginine--tRNA ligase [Bacilli bacterium]
MSIIKKLEEEIKTQISEVGYEIKDFSLVVSSRPELGDYQINDAMKLAKEYHDSPINIAGKIVEKLKENNKLTNINIAGPGFINLSLSDEFIKNSLNEINEDLKNNVDMVNKKRIFMDYGGANIAKTLHVGHLRSANIGEAVKRLAKYLGHEVISDVHFGDIGRQSGMVISEIKRRYPDLDYFNENFTGNYDDIELNITEEELGEIYPTASIAAKADEERMKEVVQITKELEEGNKSYVSLWNKIKEISIKDIKNVYKDINTTFDLYEGETECYEFIPELVERFEKENYLRVSEDAKVIDVLEDKDSSPMPPLVFIKSNGATLYATREIATLYSRVKRFNPDEFWYFTDIRQSLYFEQVFRAARKTKIVDENTKLNHYGFGTMNGKDGKPFKTRDGGVMSLKELIKIITEETAKRLNKDIVEEDKREETAKMIGIAALKYADLIPYRETDYIFDPEKFTSLEGKTGPYLLYSTIRMKSLLNKAEEKKYSFIEFNNKEDRKVALEILKLPKALNKSLEEKSLNELTDYIYKLTSSYNTFYNENKVLIEENENLRDTWIALTSLVYKTNMDILNILGINIPEKM